MDYYEKYQNYEDERLLKIIQEDRASYQEEAIEAAEQVLRERGYEIEFEQESHFDESIEEEIQRRLENGEPIDLISLDLKNRGVEGVALYDETTGENLEYTAEDEKTYKNYKRKLFRVLSIVFFFFGIYRTLYYLDTKNDFHLFGVATAFLLSIFLFRASRKKEEEDTENNSEA